MPFDNAEPTMPICNHQFGMATSATNGQPHVLFTGRSAWAIRQRAETTNPLLASLVAQSHSNELFWAFAIGSVVFPSSAEEKSQRGMMELDHAHHLSESRCFGLELEIRCPVRPSPTRRPWPFGSVRDNASETATGDLYFWPFDASSSDKRARKNEALETLCPSILHMRSYRPDSVG